MEVRNMIVLNNVRYESWYELCQAYNISYAELLKFRMDNKDIDELEILEYFIGNAAMCMRDGRYASLQRHFEKLV